VLAKLAAEGAIGSTERVVVYITGEGLKTLDATREGFRMDEIDPTVESFEQVECLESAPPRTESAGVPQG
jgi:threonine synthase